MHIDSIDSQNLVALGGDLEGLDKPLHLIHRSAHGKVIDGNLANVLLGVNDKQTPAGEKEPKTCSGAFFSSSALSEKRGFM